MRWSLRWIEQFSTAVDYRILLFTYDSTRAWSSWRLFHSGNYQYSRWWLRGTRRSLLLAKWTKDPSSQHGHTFCSPRSTTVGQSNRQVHRWRRQMEREMLKHRGEFLLRTFCWDWGMWIMYGVGLFFRNTSHFIFIFTVSHSQSKKLF